MLKKPQTEATAVWKERFRASGLWWAELARQAPSRGITIRAVSGTGQIYAWDGLAGSQRQLTDRREGVFSGFLAPDGSHVYYLRDQAGSEIGHYVRIPWEGGAEQDVTPELPPYAALYRCAVNATGTMFAFTPTEAHGFPLYCLDLYPDGTVGAPRELYRSPKLIDDACLSHNAELAVVATTEHSRARQYSLLAVQTADGRQMGTLSDLPEGSVRAVMFSPLALGKRPELWAGGMALVAPADLTSEYHDGTEWSRGYLTAMMGGTPEEKGEQYAASSPITYAAQVQAPLLVIQGRNDLRSPPAQMERYAEKMQFALLALAAIADRG